MECERPKVDTLLAPVDITKSEETVRIVLPLCGVDLRQVYVMANSRGITIEFRKKKRLQNASSGVSEIQEERIIRELRLEAEIRERSTNAQTVGANLEITCTLTEAAADRAWSELVYMDTRGSLLNHVPDSPNVHIQPGGLI